jgi:hypothetical protein
MKKALFVVFILVFYVATSSGTDFYVSPTGDDKNPGTKDRPFATITKARDAVRKIIEKGLTKSISVYLRDGRYQISEPIIFDCSDSGTEDFNITYTAYPDERPVISGGKVITGWKVNADRNWTAKIKDVESGNWNFRELFVNGRRAVRARHPDSGFFRVVKANEDRMSSFIFNKEDIPQSAIDENTELVFIHDWSISRLPVREIDYVNQILYPGAKIGRQHRMMVIDGYEPNPRYYLENNPVFCDAPGEWYLHSNGELIYKPRANEVLSKLEVIVPIANQLLVVRGMDEEGCYVRNIHFRGIIFEHCAFDLPADGYAGVQATFHPDGDKQGFEKGWREYVTPAICFDLAENCSFLDGVLRHLGGSGIMLGSRCSDCKISGSLMTDISGNGIMVGESRSRFVSNQSWWQSVPEQAAGNNVISNCLIDKCGIQFSGAVGIWVGLAHNTKISQNEIRNLPYTGVSVGWMWDNRPTPCKANIVENNYIHHIMQVLSDGGGIYTLGYQPGTVLRNNLIHDVPVNLGRAESNGMFLDEGTTNIVIENNGLYNIAKSPFRFHKAGKNLIQNNVLGLPVDIPPVRYNRTNEKDIKQVNMRIITGTEKSDELEKALMNIKEHAGPDAKYQNKFTSLLEE